LNAGSGSIYSLVSEKVMTAKKTIRDFNRRIIEILAFNKSEQRGVFVLMMILLLLVVARAVSPAWITFEPADYEMFSAEAEAFRKAWQEAADSDSMARQAKYQKYFVSQRGWPGDSLRKGTFPRQPIAMVDINLADTLDLQQLKGVGPGFARRIVAYREKLGGYYHKRQLLEIFGMDSVRYGMMQDQVILTRDSIRKMNINSVLIKELMKHPYFPFPLAKNIIQYRMKHKVFHSLDELKDAAGVSDSLFRRMVVYLRL
jgi:DNA uptake protein ComE-like DNA-binding protein